MKEGIFMELINNMEISKIIGFIHTQDFYFIIYTYFLLLVLLAEIAALFYLNYHIIKLGKKIYIDRIESESFFNDLIKKYTVLLKRQYDLVNTRSFIDSYFSRNSKVRELLIKIIENSSFFYLMMGLIGAFIVLLSAVISIDLQGLSDFEGLYTRLSSVIANLQPAAFFLIMGIISAIIINILSKIFDLSNRYKKIKVRLENYLDNNLKYKYNIEFKQLELFEKLIKNLHDNFLGLEDVIEDTVSDSLSEINETINKCFSVNKVNTSSGNKINTSIEEKSNKEVASTEE